MLRVIPYLIVGALAGCVRPTEKAFSNNSYFDLDSLLDSNIDLAAKQRVIFAKMVDFNGNIDSISGAQDSIQLRTEFEPLYEFTLNHPKYVLEYQQICSLSYVLLHLLFLNIDHS